MLVYLKSYLLFPTALFLVFLVYFRVAGDTTMRLADSFALWLRRRGLFTGNEITDEKLLNIIRIVLACILLYRLYAIGIFLHPLDATTEQLVYFMLLCVVSVALLIGFLTPLAALALLLFQLRLNSPLGTYTLGVDVTAMALLTMLLYPGGRRLSLDAWLMNKRIGAPVRYLYGFFVLTDRRDTQIALAKFISLLAYAMLCLYSVLLHIGNPSWMSGEAAIDLTASTYLSRHPELFQTLFSTSATAVVLTRISMQLMVAWYFLFLPGILIGGWARQAVLVWAVLFFIFSASVLQLSTLPYIEFCLLIVWFWDLYLNTGPTIHVLFDDRCNLCRRTIRVLRGADIFRRIDFLPLSQNTGLCKQLGVTPDDLYADIYAWKDSPGTLHKGYDFYLLVSRSLPVLMPVYPVLLFFRLIRIGPAIYAFIAKRRLALFGVCDIDRNPYIAGGDEPAPTRLQGPSARWQGIASKSFVATWGVFLAVFILFLPNSPLEKYRSLEPLRATLISAHILGLVPINVFNRHDLQMTEHYFTVTHRSSSDGREVLLPFTGARGERLSWHFSDRVYFGNSLKWRRLKNQQPILPPTERDQLFFSEIKRWGDAVLGLPEGQYRFDFYQTRPPAFNPDTGTYVFAGPNRIASHYF